MDEEEPAWRAAFRHAIYMASYNAIPTVDEVLEHLLPHILAAEERGRREAASELASLRNAVALVAKFGDMSEVARRELRDLLESP